jgi:hypothetical protein
MTPGPGGANGGYCDIVLHIPLIDCKCIDAANINESIKGAGDVLGKIGIGIAGHTPGFITVFETTPKFNIVPGAGIIGITFVSSAPVQ